MTWATLDLNLPRSGLVQPRPAEVSVGGTGRCLYRSGLLVRHHDVLSVALGTGLETLRILHGE